jgi:hypothetical protein
MWNHKSSPLPLHRKGQIEDLLLIISVLADIFFQFNHEEKIKSDRNQVSLSQCRQ